MPFFINKGKRIIKNPKICFEDTGLLRYLCITTTNQVSKEPFSGQLFGTVIHSEIVRSFYNCGETPEIHWRRITYGEEADSIGKDIQII